MPDEMLAMKMMKMPNESDVINRVLSNRTLCV